MLVFFFPFHQSHNWVVICTPLLSLSPAHSCGRGSFPLQRAGFNVTPNCMLTVFANLTQRFTARKARQLIFLAAFKPISKYRHNLKITKKKILFCSWVSGKSGKSQQSWPVYYFISKWLHLSKSISLSLDNKSWEWESVESNLLLRYRFDLEISVFDGNC